MGGVGSGDHVGTGPLLRRDAENNPEWTNWNVALPAYEVRTMGDPVSVPEPMRASLLLVAAVPLVWRASSAVGPRVPEPA